MILEMILEKQIKKIASPATAFTETLSDWSRDIKFKSLSCSRKQIKSCIFIENKNLKRSSDYFKYESISTHYQM